MRGFGLLLLFLALFAVACAGGVVALRLPGEGRLFVQKRLRGLRRGDFGAQERRGSFLRISGEQKKRTNSRGHKEKSSEGQTVPLGEGQEKSNRQRGSPGGRDREGENDARLSSPARDTPLDSSVAGYPRRLSL